MRGGVPSRVPARRVALLACVLLTSVGVSARASSESETGAGAAESLAAPAGRGDVLLFVGRGGAARPSGRLSLPALRFDAPESGTALAPHSGIRTAAVAVDVGAAAGFRRDATALGRWRFDGALQEGPPRHEPGAPAGSEARAAEVRFAGWDLLGRGRAAVSAQQRNFDPASGFLLVDGTRSIGADPDVSTAMRAELGADLLRAQPLGGGRTFSLRATASRERADTTVPGIGVLSTLSPSLDDILARHHVPAVALLDGRRAEEPPLSTPFVLLPAASRTDSIELDAEIAPESPTEGEPPPWAASLKLAVREVRRFEQETVPGRRRGPIPAAAPDALDRSHLLVAGLRVRRTHFTYRFTLLSPEGLPGNRSPLRPETFSHQLQTATPIGSSLRLNLGILRLETEDERFARNLASLHSTLGLEWTFAPRWTVGGSIRSLGSSGPGSGTFAQAFGFDALLSRSIRLPLLPRAAADGELYARASFQDDLRRAAPAASLFDQRLWGAEAGLRVLF